MNADNFSHGDEAHAAGEGPGQGATARIVAWCTRHPWIVLFIALVAAAGGELARRSLSRDVIPDLSDPQVVLVADWMGHPAPEVASEVTQVLTRGLDGVPGVTT